MPPPKTWQAGTGKGLVAKFISTLTSGQPIRHRTYELDHLGLDADDGEPGAFQLVEYRTEVVGGNLEDRGPKPGPRSAVAL